jgi:hypothetical protein
MNTYQKEKSHFKAWEELENNKDISLYRTMNSTWYIHMGIKIEKFDKDGMIVIKNGLSHGDRYTDIRQIHKDIFRDVGWTAGCLVVNIDWFTKRLENTNTESERYEEYKNKLKDYTERLKKLSVSL